MQPILNGFYFPLDPPFCRWLLLSFYTMLLTVLQAFSRSYGGILKILQSSKYLYSGVCHAVLECYRMTYAPT